MRRMAWAAWIGVVALLMGGCGGRERATAVAAREGVLLLGNGAEPRDLDPQTVSGSPEVAILNALMEGLVTYHPTDDSVPNPGVAERWEMSPDGRIWRFYLREGARWSNGDPVTAGDFVYAWRRVLEPDLGCEYADWLYIIRGAEAFNTGGSEDFSQVGIRAVSPRVFEVELIEPTADFLKILLNHTFLPVHPPTVEAWQGRTRRNSGWTAEGRFVGNGPFQLRQWKPNVIIEVERNPHYWDAASVRLNGIRFFPISDENTEMRAFDSGQLHVTNSVPVNRRPWYREHRPEFIRFDDYLGVYFYRINTTHPPLDDLRVRRALAMTVDRQRLVEAVLRSGERVAFGYTPDGVDGYRTPQGVTFDPAGARALMAEAGFPGGVGFPQIELLFNTSDNHRTIAEAVQEMWRSHLGIQVRLANKEWQVYLDTTRKLDFDIARAGWIGSLYPFSFLRNFYSDSPNNETGFADPEFDRRLDEARHTLDHGKRLALLREAEARMLDAQPVIPLYWYTNVFLIDPSVRNWNPKLNNFRPLKDVYLDPSP